jgi:hypothetical protein
MYSEYFSISIPTIKSDFSLLFNEHCRTKVIMGFLTSPSFLAAVGIILSGYALYVEHKVHHLKDGEEFSAMCDIEAIKASCR